MYDNNSLLLYAITDRAWVGKQTLHEQVESALKGGITMLQLREKDMPYEEFLKEANEIREMCHGYGVPIIINDNVDIAIACGADGVHVGLEDQPVAEIRKRVGKDFVIGATAKTVEQAQQAEKDGADYLGVGAVFPSPTKPDAIPVTLDQLEEICHSVKIPAVAIGGITEENMFELSGRGIAGLALVSAVFGADDIENAVRDMWFKTAFVLSSTRR